MTEVKTLGKKFALKFNSFYVLVFGLALLWLIAASPAKAGDISMTDGDAASFAGLIAHVEETRGQGAGIIERTISLAALGHPRGIAFGSAGAGSAFSFNLPQHAIPEAQVYAFFNLDQTLRQGETGRVHFRAINGRENDVTLAGRVRSEALALMLPLARSGQAGFAFDYATDAVCTLIDGAMNERAPLFVLRPESSFTYRVNLGALDTVADAVRVLGDEITITLPGSDLTEDQFAAAFYLAQTLEGQGRRVLFNRLPGPLVFDGVTSIAAINDTIEDMLAHRNSGIVARALQDGRADAVIAYAALAASGAMELELGLGDIVVASSTELARLGTIHARIAGALGASNTTLRRAFRGQTLSLESFTALSILRAGHRPVIAVTDVAATRDLAALFGVRETSMGRGGLLPLSTLTAQADLNEMGARTHWVMPFSFSDLPAGTIPTHFDLSVMPGIAVNVAGQLVHVFLNDQLLRTVRLSSAGEARRLSVSLPTGLMARQNSLRVLLQRDAGRADCASREESALAQLLPTSGIRLAQGKDDPEEFYELAPYFRAGVDIVLREADLANPVAALEGLRAIARNTMPVGTATSFHFLPEGMRFAPRGAFLLYGVAPAALEAAPVRFDRGMVDVNNSAGDRLLSMADMPEASVVQIIRAFDQIGLWVSRPLELEAGAQLDFNHGNLAIVDARGIALWLNAGAPRGPLIDYVEAHFIADFLGKYRIYVLGVVWGLLTLLLIYLIVGARTKAGRG
ncbi:cellulose biosynthesis cyclic di-GMP-binding regulatory protein BcsB [bacterium AH-315-P15]|nr:cellulose biosynthesis cyclic di-GMP-binding regulatory protein BcsB [bacterium AH-315-P15]